MTSRPSTAAPILAVLAIVVMPFAYIAGIGPVLWFAESGYISPEVSQAYCAPAAFVAVRNKTCLSWLHAYARLCVPEHAADAYPPPD
jgi:hypothetical protein